jgi:hypothetical protein
VNEVPEVAIAGKRIAWLEAVGGNNLDLTVKRHVLGGGATKIVSSFAENGYGAGETADGDWVGRLAGDKNLIAYDSWHVCTAYPAGSEVDGPHCERPAPGATTDYLLSDQKLLKVVGQSSVEIATEPDVRSDQFQTPSPAVVAVDTGRIAVQAETGAVTLYSPAGDVQAQVPVPAGSFSGTALRLFRLATVRDGNLEYYHVVSGALLKSIPLEDGAVLRDLHNGLAVYLVGRTVHVLRVMNETEAVYSPPGQGTVDAQIEGSGLFYSYNFANKNKHGRIVFVPLAKVVRKLG